MSADDIRVADDPAASRYTITVGGEPAGFAAYRPQEDLLVFTHTELDPRFKGRGLGNTLASGALDDVRERGMRVVPRCPFIAAFIDRHPAYSDLVVDAS